MLHTLSTNKPGGSRLVTFTSVLRFERSESILSATPGYYVGVGGCRQVGVCIEDSNVLVVLSATPGYYGCRWV
jgi:hypothetical protein